MTCLSFFVQVRNLTLKLWMTSSTFFFYSTLHKKKLQIWSNLLKKSLMENFIFCAVIKPSSGSQNCIVPNYDNCLLWLLFFTLSSKYTIRYTVRTYEHTEHICLFQNNKETISQVPLLININCWTSVYDKTLR